MRKGRRMRLVKGGFKLGSVASKSNATRLTLHATDSVVSMICFVTLSYDNGGQG